MNLYQRVIHHRTYARKIDDRFESYEESVDRYINFLKEKFKNNNKVLTELNDIHSHINELNLVGSMRLFFSAGEAVESENAMAFNCKYQAIHELKSFPDLLYSLLCTCGVGISVRQQHIDKLPTLPTSITLSDESIVVEDTRTGWAVALYTFLNDIFYNGISKKFDTHKVRDKGAPLLTSGGYASGPKPLHDLRDFIEKICLNALGRKLKPIECFDICCMIADCAVQGGVRRAALITLFDDTDDEMFNAKSKENLINNPHRYNSNNTMVWYGDESKIDKMIETNKVNGEPGILFYKNLITKMEKLGRLDDGLGFGVNPCVTGETLVLTKDGYKQIASIVDTEVEIWNGKEWSIVTPFSTGKNEIYSIKFANGMTVNCTPYHKWHTVSGIKESKQLTLSDRLIGWKEPSGVDVINHKVISIENNGIIEETYCLTEPKRHTFIANGVITGNCGEIVLRSDSFCNLVEAILRPNHTLHDDMLKVRYATILALLQGNLTNYGFITTRANYNQENDPIIGVSLTGLCDCPQYSKDKDYQKRFAILKQVVDNTVNEFWKTVGLKTKPLACTCIKPSGTVSKLANTSSGIHPRYSKFYVNRIIIGTDSRLYSSLAEAGIPYLEFDCIDGRVFEFPQKAPEEAITVNDMSAIDQLVYTNNVNDVWCDHNTSVTIYVEKDEWEDVKKILKSKHSFISLSFLPKEVTSDTSGFLYLPLEAIDEDEYNRRKAIEDKIDINKVLNIKETTANQHKEFACVGGSCSF